MGYMFKNLGRMMGRSYEETVYILIKCLKNAESQMRVEIIITLEKVGNKLIIFKYLIYTILKKLYMFKNRFVVVWEVLWVIFTRIFTKPLDIL